MITRSRQDWSVGATVKVGGLQLRVVGVKSGLWESWNHGMPDIYELESLDGSKRYECTPHNGLCGCDPGLKRIRGRSNCRVCRARTA